MMTKFEGFLVKNNTIGMSNSSVSSDLMNAIPEFVHVYIKIVTFI